MLARDFFYVFYVLKSIEKSKYFNIILKKNQNKEKKNV